MKLQHIIISFLFVNATVIFAQQGVGSEQDIYEGEVSKMITVPNSPEAQAFTKYGDGEVNMFSGTPQIAIPLHTIEGRESNIPVSLTYDASGVRVEQKATWVGLSWNLNVGGRISRIVNGLPDDYFQRGLDNLSYAYKTMFNHFGTGQEESIAEQTGRYLEDYVSTINPRFSSIDEGKEYYEFLYEVNQNRVDTQPDYFSLNVMGLNETIVFERVGNENIPRVMNNPRIKVEPSFESIFIQGVTLPYISKWKITGEDGTQYFFDLMEETIRKNEGDVGEPLGDIGDTSYASSWVLTKVISKNQKDKYTLGYSGRFFETQPVLPSTSSVATLNIPPDNPNWIPPFQDSRLAASNVTSSIRNQYLRTITYNGVLVARFYLGDRYDVPLDIRSTRLESIDFSDSSGGPLKSIVFDNDDYFNLDGANPANLGASNKGYSDVRLKLNGMAIKGKDQNVYENYYFNYISPDNLPDRSSMAQDYLGYYNGSNNLTMYSSYPLGDKTVPGADREPNCQYSMIGLLNQITYPTGGRTVYTYESHDEERSVTTSGLDLVHSFSVSNSTNSDPDLFINENGVNCLDISPQHKILIKAFKVTETREYVLEYTGGNGRAIIADPAFSPNRFSSYCDFDNNTGGVIWQSSSTGTDVLTLEAGASYKIMVQSNYASNTFGTVVLNIKKDFSNTVRSKVPIGGHRIAKISDYSNENTVALTKHYSYEKDGKSTSNINYMPRALAEIPIVTDADVSQSINNKRLVRYASAPASNAPYVVYTSVTEFRDEGTGSFLGKTTYDFFNGNQGATPHLDPPYSNYFAASMKPGTVKERSVFNKDNELVARDSTAYFETWPRPYRVRGLVVTTEEDHFDEVITLEEYNIGSGSYYVGPVYRSAWSDCTGTSSGGRLGANCPIPSYYNDYGTMVQKYASLGARPTNASAIYGGVSLTKTESVFKEADGSFVSVGSTEETEYDTEPESNGETYFLPKRKRITDSKNEVYETEFTYAFERVGIAYDKLIQNNNLVEVVRSETIKDPDNSGGETMAIREIEYTVFQPSVESIVLPTLVKTQKGNGSATALEDRVVFDFYTNGNLKTSKRADGPTTVYLWGYDQMYPVAKIANATYAEVQGALNIGGDFDTGNSGMTPQQETDLRNGLPEALISTYTYIPSVGVASMTDPRGYTTTYEYDGFNRLKAARDQGGKLLSDHEYGYKQRASN